MVWFGGARLGWVRLGFRGMVGHGPVRFCPVMSGLDFTVKWGEVG